MAERVLSIEMGYSLTKVCEMELGGKTPRIYNSFMVVTPEGMLKDGIVDSDDEFVNTFLRMMTVKRIKTRKAIFTISSSKIATREARIPYCKESKIKDVVRANLSDYFPIDGSQFMFSHSIIGLEFEQDNSAEDTKQLESRENMTKAEQVKAELEAGGKASAKKKGKPIGYKVLLLAAPKQLVQSYEKLASNIGLQIQSLDYNGNSIYQAAKEECRDGVQLIVKVDEKATLLMVTEDGATTLNRTIPYGVDDAIKRLMGTYGFGEVNTYEKALEAARRRNVLMSSFDECDPESTNSEVKDKSGITLTLRSLAGGIIRVIDYYNANHSKRPIEKMLITGLGADFQGLDVLLTSEIGLKIRDVTNVGGVDISRVFRGAAYSEYVGCIGACIAPINFYPESADEESSRGGEASVSANTIAFIFLGAGIVAAIVMVVMTMVPYMRESKKNSDYKAKIEELQPVYDMYLNYLELTDDVKYVETLDAASKNRNEQFVQFLGDLESCLPQSALVECIYVNGDGVSMDVDVLTKEEVAATINALKQLPYFVDTEVTGVSEYVQETGETQYGFTVAMVYAPLFEEVTEGAEGENAEDAGAAEEVE